MTRASNCHFHFICGFVFLVGTGTVASSVAESQSPSLFAANAVRGALEENGILPEMTITSRSLREMRNVVSRHLDAQLLDKSQSILGRDFRYHSSDLSRTEQLGVIVFEYSSSRVARQMATALTKQKNLFRNSKVLIRFSTVLLNNLLVVIYSENSGDARIVKALNNLNSDFARASGSGSVQWIERGAGPVQE